MISPAQERQAWAAIAQHLGAIGLFRMQPALLAHMRHRIGELQGAAAEFEFALVGDSAGLALHTSAGRWVPPSAQPAVSLWAATVSPGRPVPYPGHHRAGYMALRRFLDALARHDPDAARVLDFSRDTDAGLRLSADPAGRRLVWLTWRPPVQGLRVISTAPPAYAGATLLTSA